MPGTAGPFMRTPILYQGFTFETLNPKSQIGNPLNLNPKPLNPRPLCVSDRVVLGEPHSSLVRNLPARSTVLGVFHLHFAGLLF